MDNAFAYGKDHGIELGKDYPYTASDDDCKYNAKKGVAHVASFVDVAENDGDALLAAVAQQPVSVAVNAGSIGW